MPATCAAPIAVSVASVSSQVGALGTGRVALAKASLVALMAALAVSCLGFCLCRSKESVQWLYELSAMREEPMVEVHQANELA